MPRSAFKAPVVAWVNLGNIPKSELNTTVSELPLLSWYSAVFQKRRVSDLLSSFIPEDEAALMKNGRWDASISTDQSGMLWTHGIQS